MQARDIPTLATIGFTKKSAKQFFSILKEFGVKTLIDTRIRNSSQLSGFAKANDLEYFVKMLLSANYRHESLLAPSAESLKAYRNKELTWSEYEERYKTLLNERHVEKLLDQKLFFDHAVLLCSEDTSAKCHRRLAVDYLAEHWGPIFRKDL